MAVCVPERGQHRFETVAVVLPRIARQLAGAGMQAALVGRNNEHAVPLSQLRQAFRKQIVQLRKQIAFDTARGAVETHAVNSTPLQSGSEQVQNDQRQQISAGGDAEQAAIAVRQLQNVAGEEGKQRAADGSRHAANADHRAHRAARKHIRGRGEEIRRPALMRARSHADQRRRRSTPT